MPLDIVFTSPLYRFPKVELLDHTVVPFKKDFFEEPPCSFPQRLFHQQFSSSFFIPILTRIHISFFYDRHFNRCEVMSYDLICIFLIISHIKHFLYTFWPFLCLLWDNVYLGHLSVFNYIITILAIELYKFFIPFFFFFWSFQGCTLNVWRFPSWGSNWSRSCRPSPQPQQHGIRAASETYTTTHGNAGSLTY